jgi:hypothetical protein
MKRIAVLFLMLTNFRCLAHETNITALTDWSEPVDYFGHAIRGRLLVIEGDEPSYGGPRTEPHSMTFVELQNVSIGASLKLYFDVMGLNCGLVSTNDLPVPLTSSRGVHDSRPLLPYWVILPYNSTIRLFINSGYSSPLTIFQNGKPWCYWSVEPKGTNVYFLSGTFTIGTATDGTLTVTPPEMMGTHSYADWRGTLAFPKTRILAGKVAKPRL